MSETRDTESDETFEKIREEHQREVDRLSLELLSNTKHYKKYIAKNCPEEQLKRIDESQRFLKYKSRIAALFIELLDEYENEDEPDCPVSPELHSMFKETVQKTIQHLEWSEYNKKSKEYEDDDEDMMFATVRKTRKPQHKERRSLPKDGDPYSYWGATIHKSNGQEDD